MSPDAMNPAERRAVAALASIYALRMLGLFMVLPVFALEAVRYEGYSAALAGFAIGVYGLTQALFQIPFGMASDRLGRKRVIVAGLLLFAFGSVVAALADSLPGLIVGRALQGAGAVASAVMALTADLTREAQRTKAMAGIGASIGLAFAAAMVIGPLLTATFGLAGLFWLTAALAIAGVGVLALAVPTPVSSRHHRDAQPVAAQLAAVLGRPDLLRLDGGILALHFAITAVFVGLPLELRDAAGIDPARHWLVYLGVMLGAVTLMLPCIVVAERHGLQKQVFVGAIAVLAAALAGIAAGSVAAVGLVVLMVLLFAAFNTLEAMLPSLVSRAAPAEAKGTALGVYSTCQFAGAFLGGAVGGWLHGRHGLDAVFLLGSGVTLAWLVVAMGMRPPEAVANRMLKVGRVDAGEARALSQRLAAVRGVREAVVVPEDGIAYLKVERGTLDEEALRVAVPGT